MISLIKNITLLLILSIFVAGCTSSASNISKSVYGFSGDPYLADGSGPHGNTADGYLVKGKQQFAAQNYGLAEKAFRKAVELRTDDATAWMGLAASYDQLGRFDFADRAYEQLAKLKSNNATVLNNMGYSQLLRGNYQLASTYLKKAQQLDPGMEEIHGNLHLLEKVSTS